MNLNCERKENYNIEGGKYIILYIAWLNSASCWRNRFVNLLLGNCFYTGIYSILFCNILFSIMNVIRLSIEFKSLFRHSDFHFNFFRNIFERYPLHGIWAISNLSIFEQFIIKSYASSNSFRRWNLASTIECLLLVSEYMQITKFAVYSIKKK